MSVAAVEVVSLIATAAVRDVGVPLDVVQCDCASVIPGAVQFIRMRM
jgi:hypothetical protein